MKIKSCDQCGVVLDQDKLKFPRDIYTGKYGGADPAKSVWDGEKFARFVSCPVCGANIVEE